MIYFSLDGSYGDATNLLTISQEWLRGLPLDVQENIANIGDSYRYDYVEHLAKDLHKDGFATCETCEIHLN